MKRHVLLAVLCGVWIGLPIVQAAQGSFEALAAHQELQEFIKTTSSRLRDLEEAYQAQQKRISTLEEENRQLRLELTRVTRNNASAGLEQGLNQLARDIKEVDQRRISDNKLTVEKLERLDQLIGKLGVSKPSSPAGGGTTSNQNRPRISPDSDLYEYSVEAGDNLTKIVARFREEGYEVTQKMIEDANPGVDWRRLQIKQKIVIPVKK